MSAEGSGASVEIDIFQGYFAITRIVILAIPGGLASSLAITLDVLQTANGFCRQRGRDDTFEIRSTASDSINAVHSSGALMTRPMSTALKFADVCGRCIDEVDVHSLYAAFARSGLQYGPAFRPLERAWTGPKCGAAELRRRTEH